MRLLQLNTMFHKPPRWRSGREYGPVTKKEIVKQISDELELTQLKVKDIVQKTFDSIVETLLREGRIELRNFGVFEVKRRKARKARNPRTGEPVEVEPKNVVTFKPGKEMEERVRKLDLADREKELAAVASSAPTQTAPVSDGNSHHAAVETSSASNS